MTAREKRTRTTPRRRGVVLLLSAAVTALERTECRRLGPLLKRHDEFLPQQDKKDGDGKAEEEDKTKKGFEKVWFTAGHVLEVARTSLGAWSGSWVQSSKAMDGATAKTVGLIPYTTAIQIDAAIYWSSLIQKFGFLNGPQLAQSDKEFRTDRLVQRDAAFGQYLSGRLVMDALSPSIEAEAADQTGDALIGPQKDGKVEDLDPNIATNAKSLGAGLQAVASAPFRCERLNKLVAELRSKLLPDKTGAGATVSVFPVSALLSAVCGNQASGSEGRDNEKYLAGAYGSDASERLQLLVGSLYMFRYQSSTSLLWRNSKSVGSGDLMRYWSRICCNKVKVC